MDPCDALRPYVEQAVRKYLGVDATADLETDGDGDIPIRDGSALFFVSLIDRDGTVFVRVWSIVLDDIEPTDELLRELNDINAGVVGARVFAAESRVIAATELRAATLDPPELEWACDNIGRLADWIDTTLEIRFGGRKRFDDTAT